MYTLNSTEVHAVAYDARGNGGGGTAATLTGDHQNRITDYTTIVVTDEDSDGKEVLRLERGRCIGDS